MQSDLEPKFDYWNSHPMNEEENTLTFYLSSTKYEKQHFHIFNDKMRNFLSWLEFLRLFCMFNILLLRSHECKWSRARYHKNILGQTVTFSIIFIFIFSSSWLRKCTLQSLKAHMRPSAFDNRGISAQATSLYSDS